MPTIFGKGGLYMPRWGWHDHHRDKDGTPEYLPAIQQVQEEFVLLLPYLRTGKDRGLLQLGLGECEASHELWRLFFGDVLTIDTRCCIANDVVLPGLDTRSVPALELARRRLPYDVIFIDADHTYEGVRSDHERYGPLIADGGTIVFHDALIRPQYPDLRVHRYVSELGIRVIGKEVGVAWLRT